MRVEDAVTYLRDPTRLARWFNAEYISELPLAMWDNPPQAMLWLLLNTFTQGSDHRVITCSCEAFDLTPVLPFSSGKVMDFAVSQVRGIKYVLVGKAPLRAAISDQRVRRVLRMKQPLSRRDPIDILLERVLRKSALSNRAEDLLSAISVGRVFDSEVFDVALLERSRQALAIGTPSRVSWQILFRLFWLGELLEQAGRLG